MFDNLTCKYVKTVQDVSHPHVLVHLYDVCVSIKGQTARFTTFRKSSDQYGPSSESLVLSCVLHDYAFQDKNNKESDSLKVLGVSRSEVKKWLHDYMMRN